MADYISRQQWRARPPSGGRNALSAHPRGVAVHWNGPGCAASIRDHGQCAGFVRGIQNFHMDTRKWSDIAYSMFACPHGYLFEGRGRGVGTAANGTTYGNQHYYAIYAMWGKGDGPVPEPMLDAITDGVALCRDWGAGPAVTTHNALFGTECPGSELTSLAKAGRFNGGSASKTTTKTEEKDEFDMASISDLKDAVTSAVKAHWSEALSVPGEKGKKTRNQLLITGYTRSGSAARDALVAKEFARKAAERSGVSKSQLDEIEKTVEKIFEEVSA